MEDNLPDEFDGQLDCTGLALCCAFNRSGSLLAVGCNDGRIVIWDFATRAMVKVFPAHALHPVTSLSWSRRGHRLVSSSVDNTIAIWEVLRGECKIRWTFTGPLMKVQFNPRDDNIIVVCPMKHSPILIKVDYDSSSVKHEYLPTDGDSESSAVASFDRRGEFIYLGSSKGRVTILRCPKYFDSKTSFEIVSSFRIQPIGSSPAAIREIEFAPKSKKYFLVNSTDRTIRLYDCNEAIEAGLHGQCEEHNRYQDMISKTVWKRCCFSGDKDATYVCGGSALSHSIYIWPTEGGTVKKMLQGTKGEMLLDLQWHPSKPTVTSISSGLVLVWSKAEVENWSAYAPHFKELEENQEYSESESEFDLEDEDLSKIKEPSTEQTGDDELEIDVVNVKYSQEDYKSSDEEDHDPSALEFIPISMEDHDLVEIPQH